MTFNELANFIWSIADLLRGDYKQSDYGKVVLPFTLLRRLDCVLEPTKPAVLAEAAARAGSPLPLEPFLLIKSGYTFYNASPLDLTKALADPPNLRQNLSAYIAAFRENARDIFERYNFQAQLERLDDAGLLYLVTKRFTEIDLHPAVVDNHMMGRAYEELIRKWAESSNETAGEHFTARDVIRLMVELLFAPDRDALLKGSPVRRLYDPAAGTGGMLSEADEALGRLNPRARLALFGQELNPESYAVCKADMLVKGHDTSHIVLGNSFTADGHAGRRFDYMLSNPPYGVDWKKVQDAIVKEHQTLGYDGRFGPGLPRVSDGSLLFLLHLIDKMERPEAGGCRFAIVLNGSPLFTGGAGSGESNIRKWVLENDWLEAIVALPTDMFHNTGIATYIWVLSNRKPQARAGKVQLIDAGAFFVKMRKSVGSKRKELGAAEIAQVLSLYSAFADAPQSRIVESADLGYRTITVERPLRDADGAPLFDKKGKPLPDPALRDTENVPLREEIAAYFAREVLPHVPDAWIDENKTKTGYEIPFNRYFYTYTPPRPLAEIDADLKRLGDEIRALLEEVVQ